MISYRTLLIIIMLLITSFLFSAFYIKKSEKIAYLKNTELYNNFELKKELEQKLLVVQNARKSILDSLMLQLKITSQQVDYNKGKDQSEVQLFQRQKQSFLIKEKEFDEDNKRLAEQYSQQIWKQINQYISDYGKENGYAFIYGASGDGSIMFAEDRYDITKDFTEYINNKYKGERK